MPTIAFKNELNAILPESMVVQYKELVSVSKKNLKDDIITLLNTADMMTLIKVYNTLEDTRTEKMLKEFMEG